MPIQKIKSSNLASDNEYPNLGISGVSSVRPDNHWASEGFNKQFVPLCYTAGNDRCTCATRHMEQLADAGLLPAALGSTRTYDADDCTFTTRNKFPSHLSSRLPSVQRRSETSFGLMEGPWNCGLTACDQSVSHTPQEIETQPERLRTARAPDVTAGQYSRAAGWTHSHHPGTDVSPTAHN
jgi:hypothetical protein